MCVCVYVVCVCVFVSVYMMCVCNEFFRLRKMEGTGELGKQHRKQNGDCLGDGGEQRDEGNRAMEARMPPGTVCMECHNKPISLHD